MNRADWGMVLNQANNLGDTLLQNRMMKQQETQRAADLARQQSQFDETMKWRREENEAQTNYRTNQAQDVKDWRTRNEDQQQLQTLIRANADGSLDDAGREKANAWIAQNPFLSATGIQLVKPIAKTAGTMETSQTRNFQALRELQQAIAEARTPDERQAAESALAEFKALLPGRGGESEADLETVTEVYPADPGMPDMPPTPAKPGGLFGIGAKPEQPGQPGTPATPERRVTYKQPRGGTPAQGGKALDKATAKALLDEVGGDKAKARALAKQRGYTF
jgi:hypothetical protein